MGTWSSDPPEPTQKAGFGDHQSSSTGESDRSCNSVVKLVCSRPMRHLFSKTQSESNWESHWHWPLASTYTYTPMHVYLRIYEYDCVHTHTLYIWMHTHMCTHTHLEAIHTHYSTCYYSTIMTNTWEKQLTGRQLILLSAHGWLALFLGLRREWNIMWKGMTEESFSPPKQPESKRINRKRQR